jgi:glutamate N-acetyltransferase/amino-acid N-acetyltransferase
MSHAVSPLAPKVLADMPPVPGVLFATAEAGIKYKNRTDVLFMLFDPGTTVGGVFTTSKCPSAAVDWCRANLGQGSARALVVNSGNANAFTGMKGRHTVSVTAEIAAKAAGCLAEEVFIGSTGVIGEPLDPQKFEGVLAETATRVAPGPWAEAARAIMTTDTFPKVATRTVAIDGIDVVINGMAKGAGMIAPDMATMLSFIATDAAIAAPVLQSLIAEAAIDSFNATTIDGDTSTSDTLLLFASGKAAERGQAPLSDSSDPRLDDFRAGLKSLCLELAQYVARDGEGARKFVSVKVTGAVSKLSARRIARSIANSPLVKTAIAGEDANWGRIVMAVGKAGEPADRDRLAIWFGQTQVAVAGERAEGYSEAAASAHMQRDHIEIRVDIGLGDATDTIYTCDLTKEYVAINGDYRS